jgi:hypothetical protein
LPATDLPKYQEVIWPDHRRHGRGAWNWPMPPCDIIDSSDASFAPVHFPTNMEGPDQPEGLHGHR